jgi:uncharacterized protein YceK
MNKLNWCVMISGVFMMAGCSKMMNRSAPAAASETKANAEAKLCQNMSEKQSAIRNYPDINQDTPLSAVKDANDQVEKAVNDVQASANKIDNPGTLQVQAAWKELQSSVNNVPGGRSTVGDASDSVQANASKLQAAWDRLYGSMQCGA